MSEIQTFCDMLLSSFALNVKTGHEHSTPNGRLLECRFCPAQRAVAAGTFSSALWRELTGFMLLRGDRLRLVKPAAGMPNLRMRDAAESSGIEWRFARNS